MILFAVGSVVARHDGRIVADSRTSSHDFKIAYWIGLILALSLFVMYLFQKFYPGAMPLLSYALPPILAGVSVVASCSALKRYWESLESVLSRIWMSFTVGMALWFLGELGQAVYVLILRIEVVPRPSVADIFWLGGYIPLFAALLMYVRVFQPAISRAMLTLASATVAVASLAISPLMVNAALDATEETGALIVNLAYPALDLVLFLVAILALLVFTTTRLRRLNISTAWLLINAGILLNVVADVLFGYASVGKGYSQPGHLLDLLFHWGYILFALAFLTHMRQL